MRFRFWRRERRDQQLDEEIQSHLQMAIRERIERGESAKQAEESARREFGNEVLVKEATRETWGLGWLERFWQDMHYGARMLWKSPGFMAVAVLTLALGIGANTAIFSFVNAWIIKPLPYPHSDRLVIVLPHDTKKGDVGHEITPADFADLQQQTTKLDDLAAWTGWAYNLTSDGAPERVTGGRVSWNFLRSLGVQPILGRTFVPQEDRTGGGHVAILSRGLWESRFAADPQVIGRTITVNGESCTVVGVLPANFQFPLMGRANIWTPMALTDKELADRDDSWFQVVGRLKPGVQLGDADAELQAVAERLEKAYPKSNTNENFIVHTLRAEIGQESGDDPVLFCFWMVGFVLLIACANVASLMLARSMRRAKEFAMRTALGATRGRLIRQLLTESLLLFLFGGAAGMLFGVWGLHWIDGAIPERSRGYLLNFGHVALDWTTLGYALGITLLCGVMSGLAPAFESSGFDLNRALKEESGQASGSRRSTLLRRIFVASEVALAVVVLICATLLVKSFVNMVHADPGFRPANVMVAQLELPKTKYAGDSQVRAFYDRALERIRALPQVSSAGAVEFVPFGDSGSTVVIHPAGRPPAEPGEEMGARYFAATPEYFSTMQIPLIDGRVFTAQDAAGSMPVVVVNQRLASQVWPNENPLGQKLEIGEQKTICTVVGVVSTVKHNTFGDRPERQLYVPFAQFPHRDMGIVVRSSADRALIAGSIRDAIWSIDGDQPISQVLPLSDMIAEMNAPNWILTQLMGFFGALAMFLGAIGIYGIMAFSVAQRTHEIGVRMTLGARPQQVMRLVIGQGLKLTFIGIAAGLVAALGMARLMGFILYQEKATDPVAFVGIPILFVLVALASCWIPARRAMRLDPMVALRYE